MKSCLLRRTSWITHCRARPSPLSGLEASQSQSQSQPRPGRAAAGRATPRAWPAARSEMVSRPWLLSALRAGVMVTCMYRRRTRSCSVPETPGQLRDNSSEYQQHDIHIERQTCGSPVSVQRILARLVPPVRAVGVHRADPLTCLPQLASCRTNSWASVPRLTLIEKVRVLSGAHIRTPSCARASESSPTLDRPALTLPFRRATARTTASSKMSTSVGVWTRYETAAPVTPL